ncbi:PAS domain S-box protein [Labilibacter sediminis]|nr:PAS domain S-box protein [Labilibacter sediminis]
MIYNSNMISGKSKQKTVVKKTGPENNSSFLHLSKKGVIKNISQEFMSITGYKKKNLKGLHISEIISKKEKIRIENLIKGLSAEVPFAQKKIKLIGVDKKLIKTELYLTLTSLKEKAPVFAIFRKSGMHQDKYDDLYQKKEKLQILTENTNHVQLLFDTDLKCLYISNSCFSLSGYTYNELLELDLYSLIHHDDFNLVWDTLNKPETIKEQSIVFRIKHKKGDFIYVNAQIKRIFDDFNSITHYAMYIYDATQQIRSEQQLIKSKNEAESANQLKTQFLTSISHEFRTPLNAIIGFSKILEKATSDPTHCAYIKNIEHSGVQLLSMVNNLINYSRIEKGEYTISNERVDLQCFFNQLRTTINNSAEIAHKQNLKVKSHIELIDNKQVIYTDLNILTQVFLNLISNGIKFTPSGYVKYGCKPYGINNYLFFVEDTGIGIKKEDHDRIFDSLTQKDGSLTREYGGAGIGLTISKKMIDLQKGKIWLISEEDAGSAFYFTLPADGLRNKEE